MASRQLRRLQQQAQPRMDGADSEGEGEEATSPPVQAKPSLFQLLGAGDEAAASDADAEGAGDDEPKAAAEPAKPAADAARSKASRKKQRKKATAKAKQAKGTAGVEPAAQGSGEDLDQLLAELNITVDAEAAAAAAAERAQGGASSSAAGSSSVLAINPRRLKPEDELRRIFGSKVVAAESRTEDPAHIPGAGRRVRRLMARGLIQRQQLRPGLLITPRDHWPRPDGSLSMEQLPEAPGSEDRVFAFVHSPAYRAASREFRAVQESYDPNALLAFVHHNPSHVGGLLEASELYRGTGQNDSADDLLEQALYVLETAWHPRCQPVTHGRCRLALDRPENAEQQTALFRYIQVLARRGLHSSALECAKLLLQLQGGESPHLLACIDYIALKAGRPDWLEELLAEIDPAGDRAAFLPNLTYSLALAAWLREGSAGSGEPSQGCLARGARAVMQYPCIVPPLLEWLQEKGVHPDAEWRSLLQSELFAFAQDHGSASLAHLTDIYVERSAALYKDPKLLGWLKRCCRAAAAPEAAAQRRNWAVVRAQCFPPSAENAFSHLRLSQFTDDVQRLPDEVVQAMRVNQAAAPELPPEAMEQLAAIQAAAAEHPEIHDIAARLHAREHVTDEELQQLNPFIALVQTLLPWVAVGEPGEAGQAAGAAPEGGEEGGPEA